MVDSDFHPKEKGDEQLVDRISQLPNDFLVYILSFLTMEDAVRTSVLSKRWIDLWMFVTRLDFDTSKRSKICKSKRPDYVKWVNKVLQSHRAMVLNEFRIRFYLGKSSQDDIDKWLKYALTRKVHRLDLDLSEYSGLALGGSASYVFPRDLLSLGGGCSSAPVISSYCVTDVNSEALFGFKTLRDLTLKNVNVSGEVLESLLHNCPFLECLVVDGNKYLNKFNVCGPTLALKRLEIIFCHNLQLTVSDTNIVSLKTLFGQRVVLKNVPMLVDVYVGGSPGDNFIYEAISWLSDCLSRLEFLALRVLDVHVVEDIDVALPQLTKLKQLTLVVLASNDDSLIAFTALVRASPNLEKFVLKLEWKDNMQRTRRKSKKALGFPLEHLKVVELCGYYGRTTEVELVEYFLGNAVALERIIVDPRNVMSFVYCPRKQQRKKERIVRELARKQLEGLVPSDVELVIV